MNDDFDNQGIVDEFLFLRSKKTVLWIEFFYQICRNE